MRGLVFHFDGPGVGFWIAGLPSPLVFGVLGVILALIPMVGPALLWVPAAIWLAIQGHHGHAIFLALWGAVVVSLVDNLLRPLLISGRAEVPTLAVFVGVTGAWELLVWAFDMPAFILPPPSRIAAPPSWRRKRNTASVSARSPPGRC